MKEEEKIFRSEILDRCPQTISFEEALTGDWQIVDVRSPKEFFEGSLPDAVNLPIFDNEQRHIVGKIYRQEGRKEAIDTGFDLVESQLGELINLFEPFRDKDIALFCARGGMRSRSVVNFLLRNGFSAYQIEGGYKKYRHLLLDIFNGFKPDCIVIHGHTGTGKTRILHQLDHVIDLEDLAQHQSSLFGGLNRQPRSQKSFDCHFHKLICNLSAPPYFVEGESRKMGDIYLPTGLFQAMKEGRLVYVHASIETRVARIVEDYPINDEVTFERVKQILLSLKSKIGKSSVEKMCNYLTKGELHELVYILLTEYYDQRYDNSLKRYNYSLELSSENIQHAADELTAFRKTLIELS